MRESGWPAVGGCLASLVDGAVSSADKEGAVVQNHLPVRSPCELSRGLGAGRQELVDRRYLVMVGDGALAPCGGDSDGHEWLRMSLCVGRRCSIRDAAVASRRA